MEVRCRRWFIADSAATVCCAGPVKAIWAIQSRIPSAPAAELWWRRRAAATLLQWEHAGFIKARPLLPFLLCSRPRPFCSPAQRILTIYQPRKGDDGAWRADSHKHASWIYMRTSSLDESDLRGWKNLIFEVFSRKLKVMTNLNLRHSTSLLLSFEQTGLKMSHTVICWGTVTSQTQISGVIQL